MKNFLKLILLVVSLFSFNKNAFSCDALNISIGEEVSQASEVIDVIEEYVKEDYEEYATVEYQDNTIYYCPDIGLDNTILKVFINESKIVGIRLETWDPNIEKNKIYEYAKSIYGKLEEEQPEKRVGNRKVVKYSFEMDEPQFGETTEIRIKVVDKYKKESVSDNEFEYYD